MTPSARTLQALRSDGFYAAVVEHWNPFAHKRQDLFGFGDILAFRPGQPGSVLVQATDGSDHSKRRAKILANPLAKDWLKAGNWIRVDSWRKNSKGRWVGRHEYITADMMPAFDHATKETP